MEWEESWNTMEQFSVTVIPSDQLAASDQSDLFQDMQPVLKKTRKVVSSPVSMATNTVVEVLLLW